MIFKEGDPSDYVYFLKEGTVEISVVLNIESEVMKELGEDEQEKLKMRKQDESHIKPFKSFELKKPASEQVKQKRIVFIEIESLQYFGEKEIFEKLKRRTSQARCTSYYVRLYRIHKKKLFGFNIMNRRAK